MPAKKQITKDAIIKAAIDIVREHGIDAVNVRSLAKKLKCSTQPIYLSFKGMDELKQELIKSAEKAYDKYIEQSIIHDRSSHILISILRDVTEEEIQRHEKEEIGRQTAEIADKVVDKQMRIVQEIASLLGETAAETKIALTKLKESIANEENE